MKLSNKIGANYGMPILGLGAALVLVGLLVSFADQYRETKTKSHYKRNKTYLTKHINNCILLAWKKRPLLSICQFITTYWRLDLLVKNDG